MKKVSKLSLSLASIGVFMIGLAGVLQYKAFEMENDTVTYEKVTMNDSFTGNKEVDNKNDEEKIQNYSKQKASFEGCYFKSNKF